MLWPGKLLMRFYECYTGEKCALWRFVNCGSWQDSDCISGIKMTASYICHEMVLTPYLIYLAGRLTLFSNVPAFFNRSWTQAYFITLPRLNNIPSCPEYAVEYQWLVECVLMVSCWSSLCFHTYLFYPFLSFFFLEVLCFTLFLSFFYYYS